MPELKILLGAGGHGKVLFDLLLERSERFDWVIDDAPDKRIIFGEEVRQTSELEWKSLERFLFAIGIGNNIIRRRKFDELIARGGRPMTLRHPTAFVSGASQLGEGAVVLANAVVGTESVVGKNAVVNTGSSIDHDCELGDHAHICPGVHLSGTVCVGEGTFIGTGTSVVNNLVIGAWTVIGAGSVVTKDLPSKVVAYGNPARVISSID